jgi:hypothetical protein
MALQRMVSHLQLVDPSVVAEHPNLERERVDTKE